MRTVIQRVSRCRLYIDKQVHAAIERGLLVLVGFEDSDTLEDIQWMMNKITKQRIFSDENGKMNLSVEDIQGSLMIVSQFTLYASTKKGNRPSFISSADPIYARQLYDSTLKYTKTLHGEKVQAGVFGADMQIELCNDGPVTITMDSKNKN